MVTYASAFSHMKCSRCGGEHTPDEQVLLCNEEDDGRLDIYYDYGRAKDTFTRESIEQRPKGVWRYIELLPLLDRKHVVTLGEGNTPLLTCKRLGQVIGLNQLHVKDETRNPTASFKDRAMTVGASKALEFSAETTTSASTGNAAASLSAYSARAGMKCYAFVHANAPLGKIAQLSCLGARVVRVKARDPSEDPVVGMLKLAIKKYGWYPCPSFGPFNPYQFEGVKTMAYEIAEELGWEAPDWLVAPIGGGGMLGANWKGFTDLKELGLVDRVPRMAGIQPAGCAPVVRAFEEGREPLDIEPWIDADTVAGGLKDPIPWDGDIALRAMRETGGTAVSVPDAEILDAERLLAKTEGVFGEPSGVTSVAGLTLLVKKGVIERDERVVALITGSGLKDMATVIEMFGEPPTISASLEEFEPIQAKYEER